MYGSVYTASPKSQFCWWCKRNQYEKRDQSPLKQLNEIAVVTVLQWWAKKAMPMKVVEGVTFVFLLVSEILKHFELFYNLNFIQIALLFKYVLKYSNIFKLSFKFWLFKQFNFNSLIIFIIFIFFISVLPNTESIITWKKSSSESLFANVFEFNCLGQYIYSKP